MRAFTNWWFPTTQAAAAPLRGVPVELRWAGEVVWIGEINNDLPPWEMIPEMLQRASSSAKDNDFKWQTKLDRNKVHPNDFSGYCTIPGNRETWRMIVDVKKKWLWLVLVK